MPGIASIKWSDENMAKALHAFIGYGCIKVENDDAAKVAAYLGKPSETSFFDETS